MAVILGKTSIRNSVGCLESYSYRFVNCTHQGTEPSDHRPDQYYIE